MSTFESEITKADCSDVEAFNVLSDMRNIEILKNRIPADKQREFKVANMSVSISDFESDRDTCQFKINPIGMTFAAKIIEREPNKTIKFTSDQSVFSFDFWIQLKQVAEDDTRIKLTMKADLNFIIKQMVEPMIQPILNKLANAMAKIPYKKYQS